MLGQCPALSEVPKKEQQQGREKEKEKGNNSRPHLFSVLAHHLTLDSFSVAVMGCTPCQKQLNFLCQSPSLREVREGAWRQKLE